MMVMMEKKYNTCVAHFKKLSMTPDRFAGHA